MRTRLSAILCGFAMLTLSSSVMAKGAPTPQNHHCMKDGAEMTGKTRKECKKEGGKWEKEAKPAAAAPAAAPKAEAKPAADPAKK
jgi:hypothetical protein